MRINGFIKKKKTIVEKGKRTDTRKIVEGNDGESEIGMHVENSQLVKIVF